MSGHSYQSPCNVHVAASSQKPASAPVHKMQTWSDREDRALQSTYEHYRKGSHNSDNSGIDLEDDGIWELVATAMATRSPVQCLLRYMKLTEANDRQANRISEINCTVTTDEDGKRDYDDFKSPSSASTCSTGSPRKKFKDNDPSDDWTEEETERLEEVMLQYQDGTTTPDWDAIAKHFPGKAPIDCLTHWTNISLPDQVKGKGSWTPTEDSVLREKRAVYGKKWSTIAEFLPGRTGKQCRERYVNHLNPNLKRGEWTDDEEAVLISMHEHHGNKWTMISKQLPGRSDNDVKNHYHSTIKRKFDIHGKEKLVKAAIQQVFMLVDAGRLGRNVVEDWKNPHGNAPTHPVDTMPEAIVGGTHHAPPFVDPFHTIPHPVDPIAVAAAEAPMPILYDHLHYPYLHPPPHPAFPLPLYHGHHPPPGIDPHQIMIPPAFAHYPNAANENAQDVANQTDPGYNTGK